MELVPQLVELVADAIGVTLASGVEVGEVDDESFILFTNLACSRTLCLLVFGGIAS